MTRAKVILVGSGAAERANLVHRLVHRDFLANSSMMDGIAVNDYRHDKFRLESHSGTDSRYDLSKGSTIPFVCNPWAFNCWSVQTDDDPTFSGWWFHPKDRRFFGVRVTHQPSPWIGDYGNFLIMPSIPNTILDSSASDPMSGYSPSNSVFTPYYFKTKLYAYSTAKESTEIDFSVTNHGAIIRTSFPTYDNSIDESAYLQDRRITFLLIGGTGDSGTVQYDQEVGTVTVSGLTTKNSGGVAKNFAHYFYAEIYGGENGDIPLKEYVRSKSGSKTLWMDFAAQNEDHKFLTVRVATSFISVDQAKLSMHSEVGVGLSLESIAQNSKQEWNKVLQRVSVEDASCDSEIVRKDDMDLCSSTYSTVERKDMLTTFYSAMYRASLFPRLVYEVNDQNQLVHWSPYDGKVYEGALATDSGFWDAYSTVYPLLSIINPEQLGKTLQGWLNAYKEGGWLPKWASPGYRGSMVGTMGDVTLADAIVKGISGFDQEIAYEAIRKDAFEIPPEGVEGVGRECLEAYLYYGFIPSDYTSSTGFGTCSEVLSRTLNYLQSDFAIAKAAEKLGFAEDAMVLASRAGNYSYQFDKESGFFRGLVVDGNSKAMFKEIFDEFAWGGDYTEAGPWQYRFYLPYNPEGLREMYKESGRDVCDVLEEMQTMSSTFHVGSYSSEIHEQTEMIDACWGQYEHNNQPVHHVLYMFGAVDPEGYRGSCAKKGQYWIRKALTTLYKPTNDMFPGDEDNGQMSAWYILSSLGLYSLSPGTQFYQFGSPLFNKVTITLPMDATLQIIAHNNSPKNPYVNSVKWNGVVIDSIQNGINYSELMKGGILEFEMSGP